KARAAAEELRIQAETLKRRREQGASKELKIEKQNLKRRREAANELKMSNQAFEQQQNRSEETTQASSESSSSISSLVTSAVPQIASVEDSPPAYEYSDREDDDVNPIKEYLFDNAESRPNRMDQTEKIM